MSVFRHSAISLTVDPSPGGRRKTDWRCDVPAWVFHGAAISLKQGAKTEQETRAGMSITEEILGLEERRVSATNSADAAGLNEILADDYTHVGGTGVVWDKPAYIDWVGQLRREHRRANLRVVEASADVAVLVGDFENHIHHADKPTQVVQATVMQSAVKRGGRWQFLSFQITPKRDYL